MNDFMEKEELYISFREKVERYVQNRVQNKSDAEDLVSDIFEKTLRAYASYDRCRGSLSTWIYTITRNTVYDYYRRRGRVLPFAEIAEEVQDETAENGLLREEELARLAAVLKQLPQRQRDILILRFYYELSPKEIAQRMELSYANVRYLQFTALRSLKKLLPQAE